jgi:hypothetical protein
LNHFLSYRLIGRLHPETGARAGLETDQRGPNFLQLEYGRIGLFQHVLSCTLITVREPILISLSVFAKLGAERIGSAITHDV